MIIEIAGYRLRLSVSHDPLAGRLDERYGGFLDPDGTRPAELDLHLAVDPSRRPDRYHPVHVDNPPTRTRGGLDRLELDGDGFEAAFDWERGRGEAVIPDSLAHLDLVVRVGLGVGLLREGGLLLHAAGVLHQRFGLAFTGPSGAGKSTLAEICRAAGMPVLADEMVAYRPAGVGCRLAGTPFWRGRPAAAPAGGVFVLQQAPRHDVEWLAPARALPRLLEAGGCPVDTPAVQQAFFDACSGLLRRVPAYLLSFAPDAGFWRAIEARPEFAFFRPRPAPAPASDLPRLPTAARR
jgi:hypothetical protein